MLNSLNLRKLSLPFDWLNMDGLKSIKYVNENIANNFAQFIENVRLNERGYFVAEGFDYVEFMHEKELDQPNTKLKFQRRIKRFFEVIENGGVVFIHNVPVNCFNNSENVAEYVADVKRFLTLMPDKSKLCIYLRYNEDLSENEVLANELYEKLRELKVDTCKYVRGLNANGIWGLKEQYYPLLKSLNTPVRYAFPKIYIS